VDPLTRQYRRDHNDLTVKVKGGTFTAHRFYINEEWQWEFDWDNFQFEYDGLGNIKTILKGGSSYEGSTSDKTLFRHHTKSIRKTENGFRWNDKNGNWKKYDLKGRLLSYRRRNFPMATAIYEDDRFTGWSDTDGNQVLWYEYSGNTLNAVSAIDGRRVEYGYQNGLLHTVTDLRDKVTTFGYTDGRLNFISEPGGKIRKITYDPYGNLISVKDNQGVGYTFSFDYDKARREFYAYYADAAGTSTEIWYDRDGRKVREDSNGVTIKSIVRDGRTSWTTDVHGNVTRREMDEHNNLIRITYPDDSWIKYSYAQPWNQLVQSNHNGVISEYEYSSEGYLTAVVEAKSTAVERYTEHSYSATGKRLSSTVIGSRGAGDATTLFTYDDQDNLATITDPEGRKTSFLEYDPAGNPLTIEDGRNYQKHLEYDAAGTLHFVRDHNNELLSEYRYDEAGNRSSSINALQKEFTFSYDSNGRLLESEDPYGHKRITSYTPTGKVARTKDEENQINRREYDSFGRLAKTIDGAGNEISYQYAQESGCSSCSGGGKLVSKITYPTFVREMDYDNRGRLLVQRDRVSATEERITRFSYDDHGNLEKVTDPLGRATSYQYDALHRRTSETNELYEVTRYFYDTHDNMIQLQDPNLGETLFEYDLSGRLLKETRPLLQETVYSYDNNSNLISIIDPLNRKTVYSYDAFNRLQKTEYFTVATDGSPAKTIDYSYNRVGSLTGYNDGITSATYGYDDLQRRIDETINYPGFSLSHSFSFSYYGNSRKKSYTDPAGRIRTWSYDSAGRATGLDLGTGGEVSTNAFTWNSPAKVTLPGGASLNYGYNGLLQPTSLTMRDPGDNPVIDYSYSYSLNGQVTAKNTEHGNYQYGYDAVNRLETAHSPTEDEAYTYDPLGNRLTSTAHTNWVYDDNNRLQSFGLASFSYDNMGNLINKNVAGEDNTFMYTVDNRLQRVEDGDGAPLGMYYYDPFGRRLWKDVEGTRTFFHYNDEGLAGEYNASGVELRTYGYHAGSSWSSNPLFVQEAGVYYWYQNDHLGTPQKIIAENGTVVWAAGYDSFGLARVDVAVVENNLRFSGQYFDGETGLHYNWHRFYDPATGRYISADPIGLDGGINLYAYVRNDPVNWVDPWGLFYIDKDRNYAENPIGGHNQSLVDLTGPFGGICGQEGTTSATWIPDITPKACKDHDDCYDKCARECQGYDCKLKCDEDLKSANWPYGKATEKKGKKAYDDAKEKYGCECN
jgi:large repetitive protein